MGQPHVLLHVLHAKVDVRLQDALGAPTSKQEAVQKIVSEQQSVKDILGDGIFIKQEVRSFSS